MRRPGRRRPPRPWRRSLLALALAPAAIVLLTAAAPDASPSPSPTITPVMPPGRLQVIKTDPSGSTILVAGARFNVHDGTTTGNVVKVLATNSTGKAAVDLPAGRYCLEETAAPPGFQVAPDYTPDACVVVVSGQTSPPISVADPPAATPTPTPQPTPTPTPTPIQTGELQIVKVDTSGQAISTPGFTFNVRVGSAKGQVIATINTDGSGTAIAGALNPATYCVEEVSAPDGYQVAPTYSPSNCVSVASDPSQGRSPTTVTVTDPAAPTPAPSEAAAGVPSASPSPRGPARPSPAPSRAAIPVASVASVLVVLGALLLVAGGVMIALAIRRRRMPPSELPPDVWYDSTIT